MKRISGTFLLLAGLSGCISFTPGPGAGEKKTDERPAMPGVTQPGMVMSNAPATSLPTNPTWTAHPEHLGLPARPSDQLAARLGTTPGYTPANPPRLQPTPAPAPLPPPQA